MSADNWTECPKCKAIAEAEADRLIAEADRKYGIITPNEYLEMIALAREKRKKFSKEGSTLREDYNVGIFDGKFSISYMASCAKCGFKFGYDYQELINIGGKEK